MPATSRNELPARRRLPVHRRRGELIDAALRLLARSSPEDVSIDDVAAEAGASRALVYHYFGSKQDLYVAALRTAGAQLTAQLTPPDDGTPIERLAAAVHGFVTYAEQHAAGFVALLHGSPAFGSGEAVELVETVRRAVFDLLVDGLDAGAPDPLLRLTLRGWIASAETVVLCWLESRDDVSRDEVERLLVAHLVAMISCGDQGNGVLLTA